MNADVVKALTEAVLVRRLWKHVEERVTVAVVPDAEHYRHWQRNQSVTQANVIGAVTPV